MDATQKVYKEVWRTGNGTFAPTPKTEVVETKEVEKIDGNAVMALGLMLMAVGMFLIIFWQFTVLVGASAGIGVGTRKYFQNRQTQEHLTINWYK